MRQSNTTSRKARQLERDNSARQIPLLMVQPGQKFRFPGRKKAYTLVDHYGSIPVQHHSPEQGYYLTFDPACTARNSSGRLFTLRQRLFVIEA